MASMRFLVVVAALGVLSESGHAQAQSPFFAAKYVAPVNAPSAVVIADVSEPGERLIVDGQVAEGARPLVGVSLYVFHADADGLYTRDGRNSEGNARLHGAMRTDRNGRYRFETIRPRGYDDMAAHVHYVLNAPGFKTRTAELFFEGDPMLPPDVRSIYAEAAVAIRPATRNANGVWHVTRDIQLVKK
jgi:protocatechuate 3,4-dioxygenase beta subunit